jgi:hypothetical protein
MMMISRMPMVRSLPRLGRRRWSKCVGGLGRRFVLELPEESLTNQQVAVGVKNGLDPLPAPRHRVAALLQQQARP